MKISSGRTPGNEDLFRKTSELIGIINQDLPDFPAEFPV